MEKTKISGAEALMRSLENEGVKTLFGYPGEQSCLYMMRYMTIKKH